jgi:hypothetical protein
MKNAELPLYPHILVYIVQFRFCNKCPCVGTTATATGVLWITWPPMISSNSVWINLWLNSKRLLNFKYFKNGTRRGDRLVKRMCVNRTFGTKKKHFFIPVNNMEELVHSIHALKDELQIIEIELAVEQAGMRAAVSKWGEQRCMEQLLKARDEGVPWDELLHIERSLANKQAERMVAVVEWRRRKCQEDLMKARRVESEKKNPLHTPASLPSSTSSAALMPIPSDLTVRHPDFERLVDELSSRVGECDEEQDASPSALIMHGQVGYVYAAWNPLFPDLIKIGATMRAFPYLRVQELSSSAGVPEPFQLVASVPTPDPFALERAIHAFYASVRKYGRKKEFFLLSREEAVYHFHVRSLEAMGSGVSSSVEKVKKRKAGETGGQYRQYQKNSYKYSKLIRDFVVSHVERNLDKTGGYLSTQTLYDAFQRNYRDQEPQGYHILHFAGAISKHISDIYPDSRRARSCSDKGYIGIKMK